jgi:hypothetical protein
MCKKVWPQTNLKKPLRWFIKPKETLMWECREFYRSTVPITKAAFLNL